MLYFQVPIEIMKNKMLSGDEKLLLCYFVEKIGYSNYSDQYGNYYYLSSDEKAKLEHDLDKSESSFWRMIKNIKKSGFILTRQTGKGIKLYLTDKTIESYQICQLRIVKNDNSELSKMTTPLNITNKNKDKYKSNRNYTNNSIIPITVNQAQIQFKDVDVYFSEKGYQKYSLTFYNYYSSKGWIVRNKPVRDWQRLADKWLYNQFIELPKAFYDPQLINSMFGALPDYLVEQITKEQSMNGSRGRVKISTLEEINKIIGN